MCAHASDTHLPETSQTDSKGAEMSRKCRDLPAGPVLVAPARGDSLYRGVVSQSARGHIGLEVG